MSRIKFDHYDSPRYGKRYYCGTADIGSHVSGYYEDRLVAVVELRKALKKARAAIDEALAELDGGAS